MKNRDLEPQKISNTLVSHWKITRPQLKVNASVQSCGGAVGEVKVRYSFYTHEQNDLTGAKCIDEIHTGGWNIEARFEHSFARGGVEGENVSWVNIQITAWGHIFHNWHRYQCLFPLVRNGSLNSFVLLVTCPSFLFSYSLRVIKEHFFF